MAKKETTQETTATPLKYAIITPEDKVVLELVEGETVLETHTFEAAGAVPPSQVLYPVLSALADSVMQDAPPIPEVQEKYLRTFYSGTGQDGIEFSTRRSTCSTEIAKSAFKAAKLAFLRLAPALQAVATLLCLLFFVPGCKSGFLHPNTHMTIGPNGSGFTWSSDKDFEAHLRGGTFNPETKEAHIDSLDVTNTSSSVITANVAQMKVLGENYLLLGQAWANYTNSVSNLINGALDRTPGVLGGLAGLRQFQPTATISTPLGSASVPADVLKALAEEVAKQLKLPAPAPQNGGTP